MPKVDLVKCGGDINTAIRRLRRLSEKAFLWVAYRSKEHYVKPTTKRRLAKMTASKRIFKQRRKHEQTQERMRRSGRY